MAVHIGTWKIEVRPMGWTRLSDNSGGPTVYIQYAIPESAADTRLDMQTVVMEAGQEGPLTGRTWRRIPLAMAESRLLEDMEYTHGIFNYPWEGPRPTLDSLVEFFDSTKDKFTTVMIGEIGARVGDGQDGDPKGKLPIIRSPEGRLTEDFLTDVADAYRWFTAAGEPPAPSISKRAKVPVRTVHRWIYEARKRGILPPARAGRAG
ncbi:hypothetical protein [Streptomyces caniscabiei]|uniref:hypothetical protein n=1 Tax=Streptomyces caniscabiei TaxID=2746961 RepID=UPI001872468E|nr:hypothetical protein [Streptomyces caniscabiei]MBE4789960.1 hypothetical protein [Streptomyces caniscabiei]MBE4790859.1 hypothetical protein [Streptomyces caniscabiei]